MITYIFLTVAVILVTTAYYFKFAVYEGIQG